MTNAMTKTIPMTLPARHPAPTAHSARRLIDRISIGGLEAYPILSERSTLAKPTAFRAVRRHGLSLRGYVALSENAQTTGIIERTPSRAEIRSNPTISNAALLRWRAPPATTCRRAHRVGRS